MKVNAGGTAHAVFRLEDYRVTVMAWLSAKKFLRWETDLPTSVVAQRRLLWYHSLFTLPFLML